MTMAAAPDPPANGHFPTLAAGTVPTAPAETDCLKHGRHIQELQSLQAKSKERLKQLEERKALLEENLRKARQETETARAEAAKATGKLGKEQQRTVQLEAQLRKLDPARLERLETDLAAAKAELAERASPGYVPAHIQEERARAAAAQAALEEENGRLRRANADLQGAAARHAKELEDALQAKATAERKAAEARKGATIAETRAKQEEQTKDALKRERDILEDRLKKAAAPPAPDPRLSQRLEELTARLAAAEAAARRAEADTLEHHRLTVELFEVERQERALERARFERELATAKAPAEACLAKAGTAPPESAERLRAAKRQRAEAVSAIRAQLGERQEELQALEDQQRDDEALLRTAQAGEEKRQSAERIGAAKKRIRAIQQEKEGLQTREAALETDIGRLGERLAAWEELSKPLGVVLAETTPAQGETLPPPAPRATVPPPQPPVARPRDPAPPKPPLDILRLIKETGLTVNGIVFLTLLELASNLKGAPKQKPSVPALFGAARQAKLRVQSGKDLEPLDSIERIAPRGIENPALGQWAEWAGQERRQHQWRRKPKALPWSPDDLFSPEEQRRFCEELAKTTR